MAWTLFVVPNPKRVELDAVLKDDLISRQSQKLRDAAAMGGPAGETYVLLEGAPEVLHRADELLQPLGKKLAGTDGESLYKKFKDEEEAASAGMGLFFTD
jgi:hypothetical protein